jgi:hypothetical protein
MKREIKFQRVFQHCPTGLICVTTWGNINHKDEPNEDFSSFKSPSQISGYYPIADRQFTGLKDKNGKEIYESDIVEWTSKFKGTEIPTPPKRGQIQYNNQGCVFHIIYELNGIHYYKELNADTGGEDYSMTSIEVVGNIYENPELLK